ncbi:DNA-binding transcriptional regulator, MarR family [Promicromonospora umidemergens]|uniref:MarR family transcriptional regulator n=1 Tax=Promicromonospora umidemergens TaxID=629679 RepID=A0ABP8WED8_9MICO|nr:MarR family transcriptional regulator [Promicromonospora umidemergens]MCP2284421.1 DNA-binding transcriptional regulator, MarR family [Promicromonospora umidemergens]
MDDEKGARVTERGVPSAREAAEAWESLFRAQVTVMRRLLADDIWGDLSMREYDVLFTLSLAPGETLRLRELNENILMAQSSLSRMVERLEKRGLVHRHPSPDDGRGVLVSLTEEGTATQKELGRRHVRSIAHYVTPAMDAEDLRRLRELAEALRAAQPDIEDF